MSENQAAVESNALPPVKSVIATAESPTISDKRIVFSVAQLAVVISVTVSVIGTLAYVIADFITTRNAVKDLQTVNEKIKTQVDSLDRRTIVLQTRYETLKKSDSPLDFNTQSTKRSSTENH
jgi:hypothetical protein